MGSGQVRHISYQEDQAHYHRSPLNQMPCALGRQKQTRTPVQVTGYNQSLLLKLKTWKQKFFPWLCYYARQSFITWYWGGDGGTVCLCAFKPVGQLFSAYFFISIVITVNYFSIPISSYTRIIFSDALSLWRANQMLSLRGISCCGLRGRTATYLNHCSPPEM